MVLSLETPRHWYEMDLSDNPRGEGLEVRLDLRGLKCPLPAMKTRKAMGRLAQGARLVVLASDPMSAIDIPHAVQQAGGRLIQQSREGDALVFEISAAV